MSTASTTWNAGVLGVLVYLTLTWWPPSAALRGAQALLSGEAEVAHATAATGAGARAGLRRRVGRTLGAVLRRRRAVAPVDVVPLLDALAASLNAGLAPAEALRVAERTTGAGVDLSAVLQAADEGRPLAVQWQRLARREGHPDLAALSRTWTISEGLGCPLADAVATTVSSARSRVMLTQRLEAATAGATTTSTVLSLLPVGGVVMALAMGLSPLELYADPWAIGSTAAGFVLLVIGRTMMTKMISRVQYGLR